MEFDEETSLVEYRDMLNDALIQVDEYLDLLNKPQKVWLDEKFIQIRKIQNISKWN